MGRFRLIIDLASDRVVFFTNDLEEKLYTDEYTAIAEYEGDLPAGMSLRNSYNFVYKNKQLTNTVNPKKIISTLEKNKISIRKLIKSKIEEVYQKKFDTSLFHIDLNKILINEANKFINGEKVNTVLLEIARKKFNNKSTIEAVQSIIDTENNRIDWVLKAEILKDKYLSLIDEAEHDDRLFELKNEFIKEGLLL